MPGHKDLILNIAKIANNSHKWKNTSQLNQDNAVIVPADDIDDSTKLKNALITKIINFANNLKLYFDVENFTAAHIQNFVSFVQGMTVTNSLLCYWFPKLIKLITFILPRLSYSFQMQFEMSHVH